jgi:hypothetical protein
MRAADAMPQYLKSRSGGDHEGWQDHYTKSDLKNARRPRYAVKATRDTSGKDRMPSAMKNSGVTVIDLRLITSAVALVTMTNLKTARNEGTTDGFKSDLQYLCLHHI